VTEGFSVFRKKYGYSGIFTVIIDKITIPVEGSSTAGNQHIIF
jgi:hypothetical protein